MHFAAYLKENHYRDFTVPFFFLLSFNLQEHLHLFICETDLKLAVWKVPKLAHQETPH